jgi:hypothetical protein
LCSVLRFCCHLGCLSSALDGEVTLLAARREQYRVRCGGSAVGVAEMAEQRTGLFARVAPAERVETRVEFAELAAARARGLAAEAQACQERAEDLRRRLDARRQHDPNQVRRV